MAVPLKRLQSSESTQVLQIPPAPTIPFKKIRINTKKSLTVRIETLTSQLDNVATSNEALQILIRISDNIKYDESDLSECIKKLIEYYKNETESACRVKVFSLFAEFCNNRTCNATYLVDEICLRLFSEKAAKVISQGLYSLYKIGTYQTLPGTHISKIVFYAEKQLENPSHNVQRHALLILGAFSSLVEAEKNILQLIGKYTDSQDSRVRAQAFCSILKLGNRGVRLPPVLFDRAISALSDDYECVRKEALELAYNLGVMHPEAIIKVPETDSEIRLIDAAFGKVCSALCDLSMQVRTQAAKLLGGMSQVGPEFLHQTLDKKLMSNLRRKKSLHERSSDNFASGEWSSGKKWADDAPKEQVETNSVSLIASGACGALVHGLEDEFLEVRTASVDSMCRLALTSSAFAVQSLDFLVDMFNDEIEDVRLKAIYSLTAISRHIVLREDQLEIMLSSLEDYSVEVREGLHLMLGACKVSTQSCLLMVVHKILNVLSQYPQDKLSAYGCMHRIGQKHAELCMSLTPQLLQDHPFFDSAERDVEDPSYICILIMLFNAAEHMTPMLSLFPDVTVKHYAYLRDTMPNFVPHLPIGGCSRTITFIGATGSFQFLETILNNIRSSYSATKARSALLKAAQSNLNRLAEIDPAMSGSAQFTVTFLSAQLLMEQLQICTLGQQSRTPSKISLGQLMKNCLKLQNIFSGLTIDDLLLVKEISLRASALHLVLVVKDRSQSALGPCQLLLHIASDISNFLHSNSNMTPDAFTISILNQLANLTDPKPGRVFREILPLVQNSPPILTPQINVNIKMCTARILEPNQSGSLDNVLKVTAGLIAALPFVAEIDSLQEHQRKDLRLKIKYPDQNVHTVVPRIRDLKRIMTENGEEETNWRLRTTVLLSHGVWTEASQVEIILCLSVRPGTELELCKPAKILFAPKPVRRGI